MSPRLLRNRLQAQVGAQLAQCLVSLDGQIGEYLGSRAILLEQVLPGGSHSGGCVLGVCTHVQVEASAVA